MPSNEPVAIAGAIQTLLLALVAVGWLKLDNNTVNAIASVVAVLVGILVTWRARGKVTPV